MLGRSFSRRALLGALPVVFAAPAALGTAHAPQSPTGSVGDDAQEVSQALMRAICAHCAAFAHYRHLVRDPTLASLPALSEAIEAERILLLAVATYPAINDAERSDKATYLSAFRHRDA